MYELKIHRQADKNFKKAPQHIQRKVFLCPKHLTKNGLQKLPFEVDTLKGKFKKFRYFEVKIDRDYRIIFRKEGGTFFIRAAGTHNALGTG